MSMYKTLKLELCPITSQQQLEDSSTFAFTEHKHLHCPLSSHEDVSIHHHLLGRAKIISVEFSM